MPAETTNYHFKKAMPEDFYDERIVNDALDTVDATLKAVETKAENAGGGVEIMETDIPVKDRKPGHVYFKVTDRQSVAPLENLRVSPNMGIKLMEE